jgi:hypothetical protein
MKLLFFMKLYFMQVNNRPLFFYSGSIMTSFMELVFLVESCLGLR